MTSISLTLSLRSQLLTGTYFTEYKLLLESGDAILLESGDAILLESGDKPLTEAV